MDLQETASCHDWASYKQATKVQADHKGADCIHFICSPDSVPQHAGCITSDAHALYFNDRSAGCFEVISSPDFVPEQCRSSWELQGTASRCDRAGAEGHAVLASFEKCFALWLCPHQFLHCCSFRTHLICLQVNHMVKLHVVITMDCRNMYQPHA